MTKKAREEQIMNFHEMIEETFPLYEDMNDMEVAQTIWRRRGAEILGERLKQQLIEEACEWLNNNADKYVSIHVGCNENETYPYVTDDLVKDFKKHAEEQL